MLKDKHAEIASEIEKKNNELRALEKKPQKKVKERVSELDDAIAQVVPREPTSSDNRSMYEHLVKTQDNLKEDPQPWINSQKQNIRDSINELGQSVSNIGSASALKAHYPQIPDDVVERGVVDGVDMKYYVEVFEDTPVLVWYYVKDADTIHAAYGWSGEYSVDDEWFDVFGAICERENCIYLELEPSDEKVATHMVSLGFELEDGVIYYRY